MKDWSSYLVIVVLGKIIGLGPELKIKFIHKLERSTKTFVHCPIFRLAGTIACLISCELYSLAENGPYNMQHVYNPST